MKLTKRERQLQSKLGSLSARSIKKGKTKEQVSEYYREKVKNRWKNKGKSGSEVIHS